MIELEEEKNDNYKEEKNDLIEEEEEKKQIKIKKKYQKNII